MAGRAASRCPALAQLLSFAAVCPLTDRRKTGCKSELFLKNPKKYLWGIFRRLGPQKAGLGWQPQQVSDRGTNERKAKFGTLVDTCSP